MRSYANGIKVSDAEIATAYIESDPWDPEWHYTIKLRPFDQSGDSCVLPWPNLVRTRLGT